MRRAQEMFLRMAENNVRVMSEAVAFQMSMIGRGRVE